MTEIWHKLSTCQLWEDASRSHAGWSGISWKSGGVVSRGSRNSKTGIAEFARTCCATLPAKSLFASLGPCVPMTIRSQPYSSATRMMSGPGAEDIGVTASQSTWLARAIRATVSTWARAASPARVNSACASGTSAAWSRIEKCGCATDTATMRPAPERASSVPICAARTARSEPSVAMQIRSRNMIVGPWLNRAQHYHFSHTAV